MVARELLRFPGYCARDNKILPELSCKCYQQFLLSPFLLALFTLPLKHSKNKGIDWDCHLQESSMPMHIKPY